MNQDDNEESIIDTGMQEESDGASENRRGGSNPPDTYVAVAQESDSEVEMFDIGLAATHSYLDESMVPMKGRSVLEAGWRGRVPAMAHHGCVFPGETVPMILADPDDAALLSQTIKKDRLFGLLCPDETGRGISGYGVLCEVYEMGSTSQYGSSARCVSFKARAIHRFRLMQPARSIRVVAGFIKMCMVEVCVLAEAGACDSLRGARLSSLQPLSTPTYTKCERGLERRQRSLEARALEAALTPWPLFVHELFDYQRMRSTLQDYFRTIMIDKLPSEPVSLSFWVASNLVLSARDRLALFVVDNALLRLHIECQYVKQISALCCTSCLTEISRKEYILPMSSDGVHSNYVNLGGYMHDLVTVSAATKVALSGAPTAEHSWFPGYTWTIASCLTCGAHLGWKFESTKRSLRPHTFYGLCRNYIEPGKGNVARLGPALDVLHLVRYFFAADSHPTVGH